eukprot:gene21251-27267_t
MPMANGARYEVWVTQSGMVARPMNPAALEAGGEGCPAMDVKDSNGTLLADGDNVILVKDLKVKGAGETLKRGTLVKNIRLTPNPTEIEGRTATIKGLVLKTDVFEASGCGGARTPALNLTLRRDQAVPRRV